VSARSRAIEELYQMRRLAAFREHLKERLEDTRPAEPPEPLPYAVPFAKFFGQCSPVNAMDREIVDRLQEFTVVTPRLSPARLHRVEHVKCDPPIPLRHSRQHVRLPDAGHAVIRLISDSGIRQKCMPGIPSTQPRLYLQHQRHLPRPVLGRQKSDQRQRYQPVLHLYRHAVHLLTGASLPIVTAGAGGRGMR
jgi:hypothetical protein